MTAFRILNQFPVFFTNDGAVAAGGSLKFYDSGTTTPKDVYGDMALSVNNGSTITLDAAGRPSAGGALTSIWGSGNYRVRLYDSSGALQAEADDVELPGGSSLTIPSLVNGSFLTTDGSVLIWQSIRQVPDPTGQANKVLSTDGVNLTWIAQPTAPTAPITVGSADVLFGDPSGSQFLIQGGSDSAPASGTYTTSKAVTFGTAYTSCLGVYITVTGGPASGSGPYVSYMNSRPTTTGFTAVFDIAEGTSTPADIVNSVAFDWMAIGIK